MRIKSPVLAALILFVLTAASPASAAAGGSGMSSGAATKPIGSGTAGTGGAGVGAPKSPASTLAHPTVVGATAKIIQGVAYAPAYAPIEVQRLIWAGNRIRHKPYIFGGGHGVWNDLGYDCSGTVSYVLHAAGMLEISMDSSGFASWGQGGNGQWITVYTNPGHAFIEVAGIRLDTSAEGDPNPASGTGPRWRPLMHGTAGYQARHPAQF